MVGKTEASVLGLVLAHWRVELVPGFLAAGPGCPRTCFSPLVVDCGLTVWQSWEDLRHLFESSEAISTVSFEL